MTDTSLHVTLSFDPKVTSSALKHPLKTGLKKSVWRENLLTVVGGTLLASLVVLVPWTVRNPNTVANLIWAVVIGLYAFQMGWQQNTSRYISHVLNRLTDWDTQEGPTDATFGPSGITLTSPNANIRLGWPVFFSINKIAGGTVLLYGASRLVVPNACLPNDLDAATFRAGLTEWKSAHA